MQDPETDISRPQKWTGAAAFRWLLLGLALSLAPALGVELAFSDQVAFWEGVAEARKATNDASRALRFEGDLHIAQRNFEELPHRSKVLIMGNSVIAWNVHHGTVRSCCGDNNTVSKTAVTRLTMLESAMLGPTIIGMKPDLVVLSMNRWDAAGTDGWSGLRWYDPDVAHRISQTGEFVAQHTNHFSGLLRHHFLLFRHRQALLQHWGSQAGLPIGDMLNLTGGKPWTNEEITSTALPTIETRALRDLAGQLRAASIRLLVISAPTLKLTKTSQSAGYDSVTADIQQRLETHLQAMAIEEGFAFVSHDRFTGFSEDQFKDTIHLNRPGAIQFSSQLSVILNRVLKAPEATWAQPVP